jgi:hypothetical protein
VYKRQREDLGSVAEKGVPETTLENIKNGLNISVAKGAGIAPKDIPKLPGSQVKEK